MTVGVLVQARFFARLREQAGVDSARVELAPGATVEKVYRALRESFPGLEGNLALVRPVRNQEFCEWGDPIADGDELAFIPPVSGGSPAGVLFELTTDTLDARRLEAAVAHPGAGAVCTFSGVVRDFSRGVSVTHLEYEAYAGMAEKQMRSIAGEIAERWPLARVAMAHRTGRLDVGEVSVVVSVSSPHRAEALAACRWGIDRLKDSVPIWKKEHSVSGAVWIEGGDARRA